MWFPADLPSAGRRVVLRLQVRRFTCADTSCGRQTFVEQIPGLTRRHAQRTDRLRSALAEVGLALAGRAGARLADSSASPSAAARYFGWLMRCLTLARRHRGWWASTSTRCGAQGPYLRTRAG
ncbi:hypothetical protein [Streptomyces sp. NPDC055709]